MYHPEPMKVDRVEIDGQELGTMGTRWMGTQFMRKVWAIPTLVITPFLSLALPEYSLSLHSPILPKDGLYQWFSSISPGK